MKHIELTQPIEDIVQSLQEEQAELIQATVFMNPIRAMIAVYRGDLARVISLPVMPRHHTSVSLRTSFHRLMSRMSRAHHHAVKDGLQREKERQQH